MSSNNKPFTEADLASISVRVLDYFGSRENLQYYWKTTIGNEINKLALKEFGISLYRLKQVVVDYLQIEDKTKEDVKLLKQRAWKIRPAYTEEQVAAMSAKRKATCRAKYGADYIQQTDYMKSKSRATCFSRYGAYNINSTAESRQHKSELFKQKSAGELAELAEKRKSTNLKSMA